LKQLVETVRKQAKVTPNLHSDYRLSGVKRRLTRQNIFSAFFRSPTSSEAIAQLTEDTSWIGAGETSLRAFLNDAPETVIDRVLNERELESLRFGYRERVTDTDLPAHSRTAASSSVDLL